MTSWISPRERTIKGLFMLDPKRDGFHTNVIENIVSLKSVLDKYRHEISRHQSHGEHTTVCSDTPEGASTI